MRALRRGLAPALAAAAVLVVPRTYGADDSVVRIEPERVEMTMLYRGSRVHVEAAVPAGVQAAILVSGDERELALQRKGKALGLIWMNVGDVRFEAVPRLYLLRTTCPLVALAEPEVLIGAGIGVEALRARSTPGASDPALFDELVRLEWKDGLWNVEESAATLEPAGDAGGVVVAADFVLPASTPPGEYRVRVYAFAGGKAELAGEGRLQVTQAGVAGWISGLAASHGLAYGILAVVAAAGAGLFTGVVFGLGSKKGH